MQTITYTILGIPKTWQRVKTGKFGIKYKPKETGDYQNRIRDGFFEKAPKHRPVDHSVLVEVACFFPPPTTFPKYKRALALSGAIAYDKAPDADNLAKNVLDALQGLAYTNDSRVSDLLVRKRYSDRPRLEVTVHFPEQPTKATADLLDSPDQLSLFEKEE